VWALQGTQPRPSGQWPLATPSGLSKQTHWHVGSLSHVAWSTEVPLAALSTDPPKSWMIVNCSGYGRKRLSLPEPLCGTSQACSDDSSVHTEVLPRHR
jgi:hypothetical protein